MRKPPPWFVPVTRQYLHGQKDQSKGRGRLMTGNRTKGLSLCSHTSLAFKAHFLPYPSCVMLCKLHEFSEPSFLQLHMEDAERTYCLIKVQYHHGSKGVNSYTLFLNVQKQQSMLLSSIIDLSSPKSSLPSSPPPNLAE